MSNDKIEIIYYSFDFSDPQVTRVNVRWKNLTEPTNQIWGDGSKYKNFPAKISAIDILKNEIASLKFLTW